MVSRRSCCGPETSPHTPVVTAARSESGEPTSIRYSYSVDPAEDSTASKVLRLVGEARSVLELGPGPGTMTRILQERGCRVTAVECDPELARYAEPYCERLIVADLETLDFADALGEERFDAIVAADVLEHLRDPWACLWQLRGFIAPEGVLVVSIPNVAHNAVIAQMLSGRFPYTERGLLDRTHLRFFSRHDVDDLLLSCGFLPTVWERNRVPVERSEFAHAWQRLPAAVREALAHAEEGETYQYIVQARVSDAAGWAAKVRAERLAMEVDHQRLGTALDGTRKELDAARSKCDEYAKAFHEARDLIADRDKALAEYTKAFLDARDQLDQRQAELDRINRAYTEAEERMSRQDEELARLQQYITLQEHLPRDARRGLTTKVTDALRQLWRRMSWRGE